MNNFTGTGWTNWSGSVSAVPKEFHRPTSQVDLARIVARAEKLRVVGAGHSFTPLCATDGTMVSIDQMAGELVVSADRRTVTVPAGWSLKQLTRELWDHGLALPNQGDVNPQALAGALATGTHGTGRSLGSLSTFAEAFTLVLANGSITRASRQELPELFEAQRLGLGLLGVVVEVEMAVLPAYYLEERTVSVPFADVRDTFDALASAHRHAEFWWFPYADSVILKTLEPVGPCPDPPERRGVGEEAFRAMCEMSAADPAKIGELQRVAMDRPIDARRRGPAYGIFASERTVRFEEMEYEVPEADGLDVLAELVNWVRRKNLPMAFPFEYRTVASDDIWLSPMNAGPCASISVHQYAGMQWRELFAGMEQILRAAGGRPHWAKRHSLTRADVDALYPMAERFRAVRRNYDPDRKFLNSHLETLFE